MAAASRRATPEGIEGAEIVAKDVDGAVGALGQSFAKGCADALRAGADDDDFAAMLLLEPQRFFEGVGVGLVQGELEIGFVDPSAGGVDAERRIALGDLFDGDDDFHSCSTRIHCGWRRVFIILGQSSRRQLSDVEQLRSVIAAGRESIAEHGSCRRGRRWRWSARRSRRVPGRERG